jgi:hypothetical protein
MLSGHNWLRNRGCETTYRSKKRAFGALGP